MLAASLIIVAALLVEGAKLLPMFTGSWRPHRGSPVIPARFICQSSYRQGSFNSVCDAAICISGDTKRSLRQGKVTSTYGESENVR